MALIETLLDILPGGSRYLDPFSGTGTGPFEAWTRGYQAEGVDSNTFASRIAMAKTTLILGGTAKIGEALANDYLAYQGDMSPHPYGGPCGICAGANFQSEAWRWFEPSVLHDIAIARRWLDDQPLRDWDNVLRAALSSLHHRSSLWRDVHYTYVVDRSKTKKPPSGIVNHPAAFARRMKKLFRQAEIVREQLRAAGSPMSTTPAPVYRTASSEWLDTVIEPGVDLVVTSPPYFGMNDYVRSQYLTWLISPWQSYEEDLAKEVGARRGRRSGSELQRYLSVMDRAFGHVYRLMKPDGYLGVVAGESQSALAKNSDPVGALRERIQGHGFAEVWTTERRAHYRKINNTAYRTETIWLFQK